MLPWQPNQEADHHNFSYFKLPLPKQHLYKLESYYFGGYGGDVIKKHSFFFLKHVMLPWQPNKMAISHKTYKLGRQSSNDHNCQIWFTSLHWLWRKYGSFLFRSCHLKKSFFKTECCRGNQTPEFRERQCCTCWSKGHRSHNQNVVIK